MQYRQQSVTPNLEQAHTPILKKTESQGVSIPFKELLIMEFEPVDHSFKNEEVINKITFINNNISQDNLKQKADELADILADAKAYQWFVKNFIYIRIPKTTQNQIQPHILFSLLEKINNPKLFKDVTRELCKALTMLIDSSKPNTTPDDRTTLKTMGSFLGQLTLYRNKPVLTRFLNYRRLLAQNQILIFALTKLLEWSKQSLVFSLHNPWISNILHKLEEQLPTCTNNTKYEIMLLFQNISYKPPNQQPQSLPP